MSAQSFKNLSIITQPLKIKKLKTDKTFKSLKDIQDKNAKSRKGNLSIPVISCKNPKLNFYKGQTYGKFDTIPLASRGWKSRKAKGDFFTIHRWDENPAFMNMGCNETFEELGLDPLVVESLRKNGFETPTNIQTLAIPHILNGKNSLIAAETGNGKTYAFLAPILHQVLSIKQKFPEDVAFNSPLALIVVPGRELVTQTRDMARLIGGELGINVNSVIGGRTKRMMLRPRIGTPDILVGSFGAMSKLTTTGVYKLDRVSHIVLDEADTLLDDSFNERVTHFLSKFAIRGNDKDGEIDLCSGVQVSLVGATFPRSIKSILHKIIEVDSFEEVRTPYLHRIPPHIAQTFMRVGHDERSEVLLKLAKRSHVQRIPTVIFSNTSITSDWVSLFLNENDIPCININGDMKVKWRLNKFDRFQNEECDIISCTDMTSRGLNTVRAKSILNFDFPRFVSDYIHRIGRTGRVGTHGDCSVTSLVFRGCDVDLVQKIEYACRKVEDLPNVNANIKRIIDARRLKHQESLESN